MENTNDTQNRKGPVLDPALCRCCRTIKKCRLLTKEYEWLGKKEVYSDMIMDCFGLLLSHLDGDDKDNCICATCVARLREASAFRKQVLYWEEALLQAKLDLQKDDDKQVVEVKLESSDDDGSRDAPCPDDGFQNVSDSEDATALSQLKIVKTESTLTKPKLKKVITRKVSKCIDKPKKDLLLKRKLLNEMKKTKSKLNKQKRLDEPDAENNKRRDAETIVHYTTAYPFRISHGKDFFIECVYCRTMFVEPEKFRSHMEEEHKSFEMDITFARIGLNGDFGKVDISELRCRVCKKDFKKMDAIALHLQSEHEVNLCTDITKGNLIPYKLERMAYRCGICDADFLYIREASKHIFTHFGRVTCELCGKTYAREFQLAAHMLFSHNPKKVCAVCKKGFETKEERRTHIRNTKSCYPFCCCECGERFTLKRLKEAHKEQVHGHVKRSPCGKCSKVFSDSRKLTEHFILSHSDRFACPYCDMKCPNKNRLEDHIVGHTKEAKFSCDVCSKSFPRKRALLTHKWNHVEKKRFECAYCDKKFNQKTSLKTHMRRYHPDVAKDPLSFRQGVHPDNKKRKEFGEFNSLYEDYRQKPDKFFEYTRLTLDTFDYVLSNIEADIRVQINFAKAVSPAEKLFLTLRYLGHGGSLRSLAQSYRLGRSTVGKSIYQTLKAIWKKFVHLHIPQPTSENLKNTANEFYSKWQFPNCFGSIGGKYFRVIKPRDSGSEFCNNKKYSALVLQAISDADYKFVAIEVGGKGKESDGGVFHISRLNTLLDEDKFNVPPPQNLPGSDTVLPHVLVGDEAYPLKKFLMRPFPSLNLNDEKRIFNERLSRARVTIECAFAMLTAKFRIFLKCLEINIKHAKLIIEVSCLLYNIIRDRDGDGDEDFRQFWANYSNPNTSSKKSRSKRNNRATFQATTIRHKFQHYFVTHPLSE